MKDNESNVEYSQEYLLETIKGLKEALVDYESLEHKFSLAETTITVHREMFKILNVNFEKVTKERDEALIILRALPVITTCSKCSSCSPRRPLHAYPVVQYYCCRKQAAERDSVVGHGTPPPAWCPLRGV